MNKQDVFHSDGDRLYFLRCLGRAAEAFGVSIHAYVLMTNHIHLLASQEAADGFAMAIQSMGRRYVAYFNRIHGRTGTLWEGRYKASVVGTEDYLFTCYRYIELNPVRAGMVADAREYPWSSHRCNAYGHGDSLVSAHPSYLDLGDALDDRQRAYRSVFGEPLSEEMLARIRADTSQGWPIGDEAFCNEVKAQLGRRVQRLPRGWVKGRPRGCRGDTPGSTNESG